MPFLSYRIGSALIPLGLFICETSGGADVELTMSMSVREAGKKGGLSTKNRHGLSFLRQIGQKGGCTTAECHKDMLSYWGKMGGRPRKTTLTQMEEMPEEKSKQKGGRGASFRLDPGSPPPK